MPQTLPDIRRARPSREELACQRQELKSQQIALLGPAMERVSERPRRPLTKDEIEMIIALNEGIADLDTKLGRRR